MRIFRFLGLLAFAAPLTFSIAHASDGTGGTSCKPDPLGGRSLYMRGTMNNWTAQEDDAFIYRCDAWYLNVRLSSRQEFKIADAAWTNATTYGPFTQEFNGEHTLKLALTDGKADLSVGPKTFVDPRAQAVEDPVALSLRFDSRSLQHKSPFGATVAGTTVQFGLSALPGVDKLLLVIEKRRMEGNQEVLEYSEVARIPMTRSAAGATERWSAQYQFADISIYGYWFEAVINGKAYVYQNNRDPIFWTREKGSGGMGLIAVKPANDNAIRRFRHTAYAVDFKVPDWAADVVYYYIFPDRFRNGNKANDPKPGRDRYQDQGVELHKNWLDKPWVPKTGDGSDAAYNNDFFGGDLAGIIQKLDYIRDLGANTIYMTPVFKAASNHKYDTADYKNIDPAFGTNADFVRLTREAAKRGIRVIPDTSLNHSGDDSIYFDRYGNHHSNGAFANGKVNPQSPYASWYSFDDTQAEPDKKFKGWVGIAGLPELDKASPAWRAFAYGDRNSVTKLWLDRGAAGWRMDVAPWVSDDFWREWRKVVKTHKPDALTVAETWFDASKYFLGDTFDSTMNYIFRNTVLGYAAGGNAMELYGNIELMREAYPPQAFYALMNLLSTHDQARALHQFGWHADTTDAKTIALAKQRQKLAVFFQMVFPGAPTIYYGDEVSLTGGDDPYNRGTYPWADMGGKPDMDMLAEFKRLTKLRKDHAVLRRGSISAPLHLDANSIVLLREQGNTFAITATNNADQAQQLTVQVPAKLNGQTFVNALTGSTITVAQGQMKLDIPALYGTVFISKNRP